MTQSINLIPQEEQKEQRKERIVKFSSVMSILLLVLITLISGYFWYRKDQINNQILAKEAEIEKSRNDISTLSDMEVVARELDAKYKVLNDFFLNQHKYSILLDELLKRVPQGTVSIETFNIAGENKNLITLSGTGLDYISIARFIDTLSNQEFAQANPGLEKLFTNVTLNSVNLDNQDLSVTYFISIEFDSSLLK